MNGREQGDPSKVMIQLQSLFVLFLLSRAGGGNLLALTASVVVIDPARGSPKAPQAKKRSASAEDDAQVSDRQALWWYSQEAISHHDS